jgi:hypothetical protein
MENLIFPVGLGNHLTLIHVLKVSDFESEDLMQEAEKL